MSKNEISVFDTEAYKRRLHRSEIVKRYSKNIIKTKIEDYILKSTNQKTGYVSFILRKGKLFATYKRLEDARSKLREINSVTVVNIPIESILVEKYIFRRVNKKSIVYKVKITGLGMRVCKQFNTLGEAQEFKKQTMLQRDKLIAIKKTTYSAVYEYCKLHIKEHMAEKYIRSVYNTKTKTQRFVAILDYKGKRIVRRFKTLQEAQIFKASILEQISNLST